ncbi:hypothetical protein TBLA_0A10530 [Henningerozyma blattae CBS 6284]|uniref:Uncharacterized protein n=1 Tax=Henningerozyma blattae (strain ATCC 34711 / CBS 6284 / DSM 70876 / NBRC 10599 / NRRL Y-10934 / UCD 77-7) TaxID=1071380 RepID=I2GXH9_HENB6|nr:hypothetical protein TBLA_0A10530 [Tetrapisispora blattae CBS 6284]CCH58831.1 hypothetical protein TBLA_0A10530 [Tetrapisispora blattae CBS 6284]
MSSSSPLKRWKKFELLDLAEKLEIADGLSNSNKKDDLIEIIENRLDEVGDTLNIEDEYPELQTYFSKRKSRNTSHGETYNLENNEISNNFKSSQDYDAKVEKLEDEDEFPDEDFAAEESEQVVHNLAHENSHVNLKDEDERTRIENTDELDEALDNTSSNFYSFNKSKTNFNSLRFDNDPNEDGYELQEGTELIPDTGSKQVNKSFKFNFQDYMSDITLKVKKCNENVQDYLSTIYTIETIFYSIELYSLLDTYSKRDISNFNEISYDMGIWLLFSFVIPSFIAYYINFIRYDLPYVEIDPMIFHITKFLISLFFFLNDQRGRPSLSWNQNLGVLPLVFSTVGILITLYIF